MKAFVSHSIAEKELSLITLIVKTLNNHGFEVLATHNPFLNANNSNLILSSHLFIGIITNDRSIDYVMKEYRMAVKNKLPHIMLIEDKVHFSEAAKKDKNVIVFNRRNIGIANILVNEKIATAKRTIINKDNSDAKAWAWLLGGLATLAIIGTLAKDDK